MNLQDIIKTNGVIEFDTNEQLREFIRTNNLQPTEIQQSFPTINADKFLLFHRGEYCTISSRNLVDSTIIHQTFITA